MRRPRLRLLPAAALLGAFIVAGAVFLYFVGVDAIEGRNDFQFFADSNTYHETARGETHIEGLADAVALSGNFLGPLLVLSVTGQNYYLILLANVILLYFSVRLISRSLSVDSLKLLGVLFLNPLTVSSLLSVNKEILSVVCIAFLVHAYSKRSFVSILLAFATALLVRWQLAVFIFVWVAMAGPWSPVRRYRWLTVFLFVAAVSVVYLKLSSVLEPVQENFESSAVDYEGSGVFQRLVDLQNAGLYWLVYPLKAAHLLFVSGLRMDRLFNPEVFYNDVWQLLHSTATLILFLFLWKAGRARISNDLVYISIVYTAVFATTPIYAARYFYPVYLLWAIAIACPTPFPELVGGKSRAARKKVRPEPGVPITAHQLR